jgi:hypothetical protein
VLNFSAVLVIVYMFTLSEICEQTVLIDFNFKTLCGYIISYVIRKLESVTVFLQP